MTTLNTITTLLVAGLVVAPEFCGPALAGIIILGTINKYNEQQHNA